MIGEIEQEKEAIVAEVEPLRELKTGIDEIAGTGTKLPFGIVAVKEKDLEAVKEQAKAYTANRDEIGEMRERSAAVSRREQRADQREQLLDNKANELARQQQQLQQMYQRQLNLNQLLEKSEQDGRAKDKKIADLQTENTSLRGQIRSLTAQMDQIKAELWDKINNLTDKLKGAYESLMNVVKAVGMLKYDREKDQNGNYTYGKYGISNLSKAQDKLIDGLAEYGAKWAREDGFPEMAEEMEKRVGISKGIENRRATCSEAFQRLGDGALRSGFGLYWRRRRNGKLKVFVPSAKRRNNPKKRSQGLRGVEISARKCYPVP